MRFRPLPFVVFGAILAVLFATPIYAGDKLSAIESGGEAGSRPTITLATPQLSIGYGDMVFIVTTPKSGYLTIVQRGTNGSIGVVFPNDQDTDNRIVHQLRLPRAHWRLHAGGPVGKGRLLAVVTSQPLTERQIATFNFGKGYGAAGADYEEVTP